ncbi:MAG: IS110 family transposase [Nocardioidaceae bacterium]|uniref:IS110 family transposase n=3 Tax=Janibacter limosus TaxID=53458 RepID=A0A4P6MYU4_9MICO|nr:IS110 family transposase [Janibacter limosus]MDN5746162.1 IS110 family transposase [Nocardioidaceae bacterium]QBF45578.1 IS110 family transposase [Janibacter limosus]QBF46112.1 IS110 family transposase [Janibacter limosus]QBF46296.1 IS110 family transposase [Janibacter limosus]QBF47387.1 IS110 family transposase [Janibacter limosus]
MTAAAPTYPDHEAVEEVVGGIDTHADTIHVAVVTVVGRDVADEEFLTTLAGYRAATDFLQAHGVIERVGIEGTSSYGAGIARACAAAGMDVREVLRPDKTVRRKQGKSDPIDAYHAARAVLSGRSTSAPKDEKILGLRALHTARRSAVKARTATIHQIQQLLITAPDGIREKYRDLNNARLVETLARCRPNRDDLVGGAVLRAMKDLAARHAFLDEQASDLEADITAIVRTLNPGLLGAHGVGPDTAAQLLITAGGNPERLSHEASFAALCGTAPVPASSGKTNRYRLSRGGDRAANSALHRIALVRMVSHAQTRGYVQRQRDKGRSSKEILRRLKRAIAREIFKYLTRTITVPAIDDLRPMRQAKNITLTSAAQHFGVWPARISTLERGTRRDDDLANAYRAWLTAA